MKHLKKKYFLLLVTKLIEKLPDLLDASNAKEYSKSFLKNK